MDNYYDILGVKSTATPSEIRAAYKRLAFKYHPDRNPGFPEAEEIFKNVNEAYHVLSDPLKKIRYDSTFILLPLYAEAANKREMNRRRYWAYFVRNQDRPYKIDKEYFKIQGLAFLVFIVISGFCFALVHTAHYIVQQQQIKKWHANSLSLKKVNSLFGSGQFDDAFHLIETLNTQDPYEFRFVFARDSLVDVLKQMADQRFNKKDFSGAVAYYFKLQHYEQPTRSETIQRISMCQFYLGNYQESLQALKHLHHQQPRNLQLVYEIGVLNLDYLNNPEEGLTYFTLGKKLFKENLTQIYGEAFELIVNPSDVPDIYLDIFEGRARSNLLLQNYEDAVTDCNWAVFLRPGYGMGYYLRAKANAELDQTERVCRDLQKAKARGINTAEMESKFCPAPASQP